MADRSRHPWRTKEMKELFDAIVRLENDELLRTDDVGDALLSVLCRGS